MANTMDATPGRLSPLMGSLRDFGEAALNALDLVRAWFRRSLAVLLEVAGLTLLAVAAFMVATILGLLVAGAECLLAGVLLDVIEILPRLRRPKTDGGG